MLRHKGKKRKGVEKRGIFSDGVSVSERSEHANNRTEFGHWELDSMVSSREESRGVFSTFIERKSRPYTAFVGKDRTANTMEQAIRRLYEALPKGAFKSATSDRGKEFACHTIIKEDLNRLLFCQCLRSLAPKELLGEAMKMETVCCGSFTQNKPTWQR